MSAQATGWVISYSPYSGVAFAVHFSIADSVNDQNGNEFWMSVSRLAMKARTSRRTAGRAVQQMVADGFLVLLDEREGGSSLYEFVMPDVPVVFETSKKPKDGKPPKRSSRVPGSREPRGSAEGDLGRENPPLGRENPPLGRENAGGGSRGRTNPIEPKPLPREPNGGDDAKNEGDAYLGDPDDDLLGNEEDAPEEEDDPIVDRWGNRQSVVDEMDRLENKRSITWEEIEELEAERREEGKAHRKEHCESLFEYWPTKVPKRYNSCKRQFETLLKEALLVFERCCELDNHLAAILASGIEFRGGPNYVKQALKKRAEASGALLPSQAWETLVQKRLIAERFGNQAVPESTTPKTGQTALTLIAGQSG